MPNTLTFENVSPQKWQEIIDEVKSKIGLTISGDTGQAEAKGITVAWDYDGSSVLKLTVENTSWYDPSEASIDAQITNWVNSLS